MNQTLGYEPTCAECRSVYGVDHGDPEPAQGENEPSDDIGTCERCGVDYGGYYYSYTYHDASGAHGDCCAACANSIEESAQ